MGLFDQIKIDESIELPIPEGYRGPDLHSLNYQTKSLENALDKFLIKDGQLYQDHNQEFYLLEEVDNNNSESPDWRGRNDTVIVQFYESINDYSETEDAWMEFEAIFVYGNLAKPITLTEFRLSDNSKRKANTKEWQQRLKVEKELEKNWKRWFIYPKRWIFKKIRSGVYKLGAAINKIGNWIVWLSFKF